MFSFFFDKTLVSKKQWQTLCSNHPKLPRNIREVVPGLFGFGIPFEASQLELLCRGTKDRMPMKVMITLLEAPLKNGRNDLGDFEYTEGDPALGR